MDFFKFIKNIPWTVLLLLPLFIVSFSKFEISPFDSARFYLAIGLFATGIAVYFSAAREIYRRVSAKTRVDVGALKISPPRALVTSGIFSYVRNPSAIGVLLMLSGESFFFSSSLLFIYTVIVFLFMFFKIVYFEEYELHELFGNEFEKYKKRVPRWIPLPVVGKNAPKTKQICPELEHTPQASEQSRLERNVAPQKKGRPV